MEKVSKISLARNRKKITSAIPKATIENYIGIRSCACGCGKKARFTIRHPFFPDTHIGGEIVIRINDNFDCLDTIIKEMKKVLDKIS